MLHLFKSAAYLALMVATISSPIGTQLPACSLCPLFTLRRSSEVQVAVALAVDADESGLQAAALKTLAAFKHKYLTQVGND